MVPCPNFILPNKMPLKERVLIGSVWHFKLKRTRKITFFNQFCSLIKRRGLNSLQDIYKQICHKINFMAYSSSQSLKFVIVQQIVDSNSKSKIFGLLMPRCLSISFNLQGGTQSIGAIDANTTQIITKSN